LLSLDFVLIASVLAKYLAGTQSTDQVYAVARRRFREVLARWANEEQPVHALRHISDALFGTFSEVVLGAPVVPDGFVEAVDALEKVIVEETPPFEWLGAWTPSQRRFDKARKTYARLARELIYINRQHILANPPNYPSDLCQEIVGKLGGQRSDYIMHDHVVKGACGLFLAMGNPNHLLGATLYMLTAKPDLIPLKTLALAAEPRWREHMRSGPLRNIYYEMLRYISPANLLTRWSAKGLDLGDGKDPVPSNCLVGICVRDVLHHPDLWKDPSTFNPHRFDRSSGGDAANRFLHIYPMIPFSIGERKCPGPQSAEAIFAAFCAEWTEGGYVFEPVGPLTLHERAPVTRLDATHRGRIRRQF
jgi:cytochrome P450